MKPSARLSVALFASSDGQACDPPSSRKKNFPGIPKREPACDEVQEESRVEEEDQPLSTASSRRRTRYCEQRRARVRSIHYSPVDRRPLSKKGWEGNSSGWFDDEGTLSLIDPRVPKRRGVPSSAKARRSTSAATPGFLGAPTPPPLCRSCPQYLRRRVDSGSPQEQDLSYSCMPGLPWLAA